MTSPPAASAPSPTVEEGMREAVAQDIAEWMDRIPGRRGNTLTEHLLRQSGPIASALAARERERDEARAERATAIRERDVVEEELRREGEECTILETRAIVAEAENATLRASAERMEADHAEEIVKLTQALEWTKSAADDLARVCLDEKDHKAAGALQFISGFISDRFATIAPKEPDHG